MNVNIIHEKCDPSLANDKCLPRNSYLVSYIRNDELVHDVVQAGSRVDIFDHYYDNYGEVKCIKWTKGTVNPKSWDYQPSDSKKKRK